MWMSNLKKFLYLSAILLNKQSRFFCFQLISATVAVHQHAGAVTKSDLERIYRHWGVRTREELIAQADKLFSEGSYLQVYELLNKIKYAHFADVQWRICRSLFKLATDASIPKDIKENMIMEAYVLMIDTVALGIEDANVYKWMAIILDAHSRLQGTEVHVESFHQIQQYLRKSHELNPHDVVVLYMLGKLCYEMSHLSAFQRLIARVLYSTPPTASYEEAYAFLSEACEAEKEKYYIPNYYVLGKTCKHLKQYFKARYYFNRAYTMPARNAAELRCSCKAKIMDHSLDDYEISDNMTCTFGE